MASKGFFVVAKKKRKNFMWSDKMTGNLVDDILNYKIKCYFNNTDFDADTSAHDKEIRTLVTKFSEADTSYFRPEVSSVKPAEMTNEERRVYKQKVSSENNMINKGYQRVLEKIKDY